MYNYFVVVDKWFPGSGVERRVDYKGHKETFGAMGMFWILVQVVVSEVYQSKLMELCTLSRCNLFCVNYTSKLFSKP